MSNDLSPSVDRPSALFDAVYRRDYEYMIGLYVDQATEVITSHVNLQKRVTRRGGFAREEEKLDEYAQHFAYRESTADSTFRSGRRGIRAKGAEELQCQQDILLRDLAAFKEELSSEECNDDTTGLASMSMDDNDDGDGDKKVAALSSTSSRQIGIGDFSACEQSAWESAAILSNSRPPASFVVYQRSDDSDDDEDTMDLSTTSGDEDEEETDNGLPLFDGGVANATPPALGARPGELAGGSGTILHLACTLNDPLALAILLVLGADARAPHTAFRRLMIHEAACSGSVECLKLLLELGESCHESLYGNVKMPSSTTPFFPAFTLGRDASKEVKSKCYGIARAFERKTADSTTTEISTFVGALKEMLHISQQVQDGFLSALDGARLLLSQVRLQDATREALARSCSFGGRTLETTSFGYEHPSNYMRIQGYSDGHGNTPLHWASFKNEVQCVSLLLRFHADPNARAFPSGWSPLHDAAYSDSADSLKLLLEAGAEVDVRANSGATPLCFAAQENSADAAKLLLEHGASLDLRCAGSQNRDTTGVVNFHHQTHSRFSGYTPLHYCAHYNAHNAAKVLLAHPSAQEAMEIADSNEHLPIHIAVARGSSDVLRELLHAGARVDTTSQDEETEAAAAAVTAPGSPRARPTASRPIPVPPPPPAPAQQEQGDISPPRSPLAASPPVSSPVLRSMIPARPITSSKPWNCLTQNAIDECRRLISEAESEWAPDRHLLFTPTDRRCVLELLRVGKRLEQMGTGIFVDLWPLVLSFCGRGWFEVPDQQQNTNRNVVARLEDRQDGSAPSSPRRSLRRRSTEESLGSFRLDG